MSPGPGSPTSTSEHGRQLSLFLCTQYSDRTPGPCLAGAGPGSHHLGVSSVMGQGDQTSVGATTTHWKVTSAISEGTGRVPRHHRDRSPNVRIADALPRVLVFQIGPAG